MLCLETARGVCKHQSFHCLHQVNMFSFDTHLLVSKRALGKGRALGLTATFTWCSESCLLLSFLQEEDWFKVEDELISGYQRMQPQWSLSFRMYYIPFIKSHSLKLKDPLLLQNLTSKGASFKNSTGSGM